jgi:hypothetical protein
MKKPHKHRDLIIAWANGEAIQYKPCEEWIDVEWNPAWDVDTEYRIKHEVIRYRVALLSNNETITANNDDEEKSYKRIKAFKKWITDWIEVEV